VHQEDVYKLPPVRLKTKTMI